MKRDNDSATDKTALLPGQTATFANHTSYSRGINGIMVDTSGLADPGELTLVNIGNYFRFRVGTDSNPSGWNVAPAPSGVLVRQGAGVGGSDCVTVVWADNAIQNTWLQVTVLSDANGGHAGLADDDVFYFGNAVGECGNCTSDAVVDDIDVAEAPSNPHGPFNRAAIDDAYDYNRDRLVNATDIIIVRDHQTTPSTALQMITAPGLGGAGGAPTPEEVATAGGISQPDAAPERKEATSAASADEEGSAIVPPGADFAVAAAVPSAAGAASPEPWHVAPAMQDSVNKTTAAADASTVVEGAGLAESEAERAPSSVEPKTRRLLGFWPGASMWPLEAAPSPVMPMASPLAEDASASPPALSVREEEVPPDGVATAGIMADAGIAPLARFDEIAWVGHDAAPPVHFRGQVVLWPP